MIKLATFNAENFYMLLDKDYSQEEFAGLSHDAYMAMNSSIFNPNKALSKIAAIANTILKEDFDFVGLCEVGGMETLYNFNRLYLGERYDCYLHEENSRRGIFVGALVKKDRFTAVTARNMQGAFSRNLLKVTLAADGMELHFFVVHLKSHHGRDMGIEQRIEEIRQLSGLVSRRNCVVLGDFNGILIPGEHQFEFDRFLELPFRDVLEAMRVPPSSRFTHYYFRDGPRFNQLDYIFCSDDITIVDGGMLADMMPTSFDERSRLPSDHLFLTASIVPGGVREDSIPAQPPV